MLPYTLHLVFLSTVGVTGARILMAVIAIFGMVGSTLHLLFMLNIQHYMVEEGKELIQPGMPVPPL